MKEEETNKLNNALRYSGIGFQIVSIFAAGFYIGYELDRWMENEKPYFTAVLSILFLIAGLYVGLRGFAKKR